MPRREDVVKTDLGQVCLHIYYWNTAKRSQRGLRSGYYLSSIGNEGLKALCVKLWISFLKRPIDTLEDDWRSIVEEIRRWFFDAEWDEVYDFVEFVSIHFPTAQVNTRFIHACNQLLETEKAGYRFVDGLIAPITSEAEIESIEAAASSPVAEVREHLRRALDLLADRKQPDYRNSIKESISAIEALVRLHAGGAKGDLGPLLTQLQQKAGLHPALSQALNKLYGYTSDKDGIRHAMLEVPDLGFDDAKFMLVICSAFANYVQAKLPATGVPP